MWKKILFGAGILLGIGALVTIQALTDWEKSLQTVQDVGWECVATYFLFCAGTLLFPAIGWWLLLRAENVRISCWATFRANLMGFPINFFTPSMYLGSEPLKLFYVSRITGAPKRTVLATIIVGKVQEMAGLLLLLILSAIYFVWNSEYYSRGKEIMLIVSTVFLGLLLTGAIFAFVGNYKPTVKAINLLASLGVAKRKLARLRSRAEEMEQMVHEAFTQRWKRFLLAQVITLLSPITIFLRPIIFYHYLPEEEQLSLLHSSAIYVITNLVNLITIIPGSLGFYDGSITGYFGLANLGNETGVALTWVNRICDLALLVVGGILIARYGLMKVARGKEKISMEGDTRYDLPTARPK